MVNKRFPAETHLDADTFLNDKKIDAELYALLQSYSMPEMVKSTTEAVVKKDSLPKQTAICEKIGVKSTKTLRAHLSYLIEKEYLVVLPNGDYMIPRKENQYFMIPLDLIQYFRDTCTEAVIKAYIYFGMKWSYKGSGYTFTTKELGQHIGINPENNPRNTTTLNNILICLKRNGLVDWEEFTDASSGKPVPRKRLTKFSFDKPE